MPDAGLYRCLHCNRKMAASLLLHIHVYRGDAEVLRYGCPHCGGHVIPTCLTNNEDFEDTDHER